MTTTIVATETRRSINAAKTAGWLFIGAALSMAGYLGIALSIGGGYEQDLIDAAERTGASENTLPSSVNSIVVHDHAVYAVLTGLYLLLPPALLLAATIRLRAAVGDGRRSQRLALASLVVWYAYDALTFGLLSAPDHLLPPVRALDVLTVPMVSASAVLAMAALICAGEATRRAGVLRRSAVAATVLSSVLLVLGTAEMVGSGFEDPVAPIGLIPVGLILGIPLVRYASSAQRGIG